MEERLVGGSWHPSASVALEFYRVQHNFASLLRVFFDSKVMSIAICCLLDSHFVHQLELKCCWAYGSADFVQSGWTASPSRHHPLPFSALSELLCRELMSGMKELESEKRSQGLGSCGFPEHKGVEHGHRGVSELPIICPTGNAGLHFCAFWVLSALRIPLLWVI